MAGASVLVLRDPAWLRFLGLGFVVGEALAYNCQFVGGYKYIGF